MDTPGIQSQLDFDGHYEITEAQEPRIPIFLDEGMTLQAVPGVGINGYYVGTVLMPGWSRGLVSDAHWTADGYRTLSDTFLIGRGSEWDTGYRYEPYSGWDTVTALEFTFKGKKFGPTWDNTAIAGTQSNELGSSADSPDPWQLVCENGRVWLRVRTRDGAVRAWSVAIDHSADLLDVTFSLNLTSGVCTASLGGTAATVDSSQAGSGFSSTTRLRENKGAAFCVGLLPATMMYRWKWSAAAYVKDFAIHTLWVRFNGEARPYRCEFNGLTPRPQSYDPAAVSKSLPLCRVDRGCSWFNVFHHGNDPFTSQFSPGVGAAKWTAIRNLKLSGFFLSPLISVGSVFGGGGLVLENIHGDGGTRGFQTSGLNCYPVRMMNCDFTFQTERAVEITLGVGIDLDTVRCEYGRTGAIRLRETTGVVRGATINGVPGWTTPAPHSMEQFGGQVWWQSQQNNYEYYPCPPFLELTPGEDNTFETTARVTGCSNSVDPRVNLAVIHPRPQGYTKPVRLIVDSDRRATELISVAAGVNPELSGVNYTDPVTGNVVVIPAHPTDSLSLTEQQIRDLYAQLPP